MKLIRVPDKYVVDGKVCILTPPHLEGKGMVYIMPVRPSVVVEVRGGCAEVTRCSPDVDVTIIDHDNKQVGG